MLIWLYEPIPSEQLHPSLGRLPPQWLWAIHYEGYARLTISDLQPKCSNEPCVISGVNVIELNTPLASGSRIHLLHN